MRTYSKKIVPLALIFVTILAVMFSSVGCSLVGKMEEQEAKDFFQASVKRSVESKIYQWTELDNKAKKLEDSVKSQFNNYCLLDQKTDAIMTNPDGSYKNHAVQYSVNTNNFEEKIIVGSSAPKKPKNTPAKDMGFSYIKKDGVEASVMEEMSVEDILERADKANLLLAQKLFDLTLLEDEDIIFGGKYNKRQKYIKLVMLEFSISDEFFANYEKTYGKPSVLKGIGVAVEIAYDKISIVTVFDNKVVDDAGNKFPNEVYKMEVVYIGP
ncbi:MAG: hypothetical protein RR416_05135, partial [Clostridia bacterium]